MDPQMPGSLSPRLLTFITTYRCTAACEQCCFESNPTIKGQLSKDEMIRAMRESKRKFPTIAVVVFTGGEATLLKNDLVETIAEATGLGLATRIVSNGSWGKTKASAKRLADKLASAGLSELNISSGKDHQEWVPHSSVVNAAEAAMGAGISTLVTVEADTADGTSLRTFVEDPTMRRLMTEGLRLQSNSWMQFKHTEEKRSHVLPTGIRATPCEQVHHNIVVTPYKEVAACCGLTLEHIPEMKLGRLEDGIAASYQTQCNDFLKYWIKVDGPGEIIRRVMGDEAASRILEGSVHMCHDCAVLHKNGEIRERLLSSYQEFVPEVMSRYALSTAVEKLAETKGVAA